MKKYATNGPEAPLKWCTRLKLSSEAKNPSSAVPDSLIVLIRRAFGHANADPAQSTESL